MLTVDAIDFIQSLLEGSISSITPQEKSLVLENKEKVLPLVLSVLSKEIPSLVEEGFCSRPTALFWALELGCLLKVQQAFDWLRMLCHLPMDILYHNLGLEFVTENLCYLLANVADRKWSLLKAEIEDSSLDEFIRAACIEALTFLVTNKTIDRLEIISYFHSLFQRILQQKLNDVVLATHLSISCARLWPGECIEDIRELFGLNLINTDFISLTYPLAYLAAGKEACLEETRLRMLRQDPLRHYSGFPFSKEQEEEFCNMLKRIWQLRLEIKYNDSSFLEESQVYNKKQGSEKLALKEVMQTTLSHDPLCHLTEDIPFSDRSVISSLLPPSQENVKAISSYLFTYPHLPFFHYTLYKTYQHLQKQHEAFEVLRSLLQKFPDYFFGRAEYALYLLRRGEPKKAYAMLSYAKTLAQLYPSKEKFHISEWISFAYVVGLCLTQLNEVNQASVYLDILQTIDPHAPETLDLSMKIRK